MLLYILNMDNVHWTACLQVFTPSLFIPDTRDPCWLKWRTSPFCTRFLDFCKCTRQRHRSTVWKNVLQFKHLVYRRRADGNNYNTVLHSITSRSNYGMLTALTVILIILYTHYILNYPIHLRDIQEKQYVWVRQQVSRTSLIPFFLPPLSDKKPLHARHELLYAALRAGSSPLTDKVELSMRTTFKGGQDPPRGPSAKNLMQQMFGST